jgi:predicted O-methyltransferase YrrM
VDEHSLHSPFFFDFYAGVVKGKMNTLENIEALRKKLLADNREIEVKDLGSGASGQRLRKVSSIAKTSLSSAKFSALYNRIIARYDHSTILELGTSLGINTLYLANKKKSKVITFEGSDEIASLAEITFEFAGASNIKLVKGNIDSTLPDILQSIRKIDFVFMDANHTYEATLKYFNWLLSCIHEKTVIVIDDIHYNSGMEKAWNEIRASQRVHSSADLFKAGILFFDPSLNKQHVILQF